jgi:hypothetical protein
MGEVLCILLILVSGTSVHEEAMKMIDFKDCVGTSKLPDVN